MNPTIILISFGVSIWLACMILAIILPINPNILKITKNFVCPKENELIIQTAVYSYHRPGQKALEIYYLDDDGAVKDVGLQAITIFWIILFIIIVPISYLAVTQLNSAIMMNY
jgi:hypothetical protein